MKRANSGIDYNPAPTQRRRIETVADFVKDGGEAEREIRERLRKLSATRGEHELWTYFDKDQKVAFGVTFDLLDLDTYKSLRRRMLASEARKKAANEIAKVNNANAMEAFVSGAAKTGSLVVMFMNIGSGDCIFIQTPKGKTIVIDCGQRATPTNRKRYAKEIKDMLASELFLNKQKQLFALILTHPDQDHYKEVVNIIGKSNISIRHLFFTMAKGDYAANKTFETLDKATVINRIAINDLGISIENNFVGNKIDKYYERGISKLQILGNKAGMDGWNEDNCSIHLLAAGVPPTHNETEANAASIVTLIQAFNRKILLCGDSTLSTEEFVIDKHADLLADIDLAQMEHHGSGTEHAGVKYVGKINPIVAVASSGPHEGDKNPRWSTIARYADPAETMANRTGLHRLTKTLDAHEIKYSVNEEWTPRNANEWKNKYPKYGIFTTESNGDLCFEIDKNGNIIREFTQSKKRHIYTIPRNGPVTAEEKDIPGGTS